MFILLQVTGLVAVYTELWVCGYFYELNSSELAWIVKGLRDTAQRGRRLKYESVTAVFNTFV